jgi:hypothetical protein
LNFNKYTRSTIGLHYTIYDSNTQITKKLPSDTILLLTNLVNVKNLKYTYVNIMQQTNGSSRGIFISNKCNSHNSWNEIGAISICFITNPITFVKQHKQ